MGEVTSCAALFEVWSGGTQMQNWLFCTSVPIYCGTEVHSGLFCTCVPRLISWNHWNFAVSPKVRWVVLRDASAESAVLHVRPVSALYSPRIITRRKRVSGSCATYASRVR